MNETNAGTITLAYLFFTAPIRKKMDKKKKNIKEFSTQSSSKHLNAMLKKKKHTNRKTYRYKT